MDSKNFGQTRRDFLKSLAMSGSVLTFASNQIFTLAKPIDKIPIDENFNYKFKTISARHIKELKPWFDKLKAEKQISSNEIFRGYIDKFVFNPDEILPGAKSVIIISMPLKAASITFHKKGKAYEILLPTDYYDDGATFESITNRIKKDFSISDKSRIVYRVKLPLKTLAVRSGLARYGRNNITYIDDYGSFHRLVGFYTDVELEDNWGPLEMLHFCKGCSLCYYNCPTKAITKNKFPVNIGECVTLYNERTEPFPESLDPTSHNTLVGCLKCQWDCPANDECRMKIVKLGELNERETEFVLNQGKDEKLYKTILKKLELFPYANDLAYFSRNLNAVLANAEKKQFHFQHK